MELRVQRKRLVFSGSGGITIPNAYHFGTGDFTIEITFKINETIGWGYIFANKNDFLGNFIRLGFNRDTGQIRYYVEGVDGTNKHFVTTKDFADGKWHTVTAVRKGNTGYVYVDGILEAENDLVEGDFGNTGTYYIGNAFRGYLENVKVWNRALSASEVANTAGTLLNGDEPGLVGYWLLGEGSGTTINDKTANARHGTVAGAPWKNTDVGIHGIYVLRKGRLVKGVGRVQTAEGVKEFYRPIDYKTDFGSIAKNVSLYSAKTSLTGAVSAGETVLPVDSTNGFYAGRDVTITDGVSSEVLNVLSVGTSTIVVSALKNSYGVNSMVARSNALVDNGLRINTIGAYDIEGQLMSDSNVAIATQSFFEEDFNGELTYSVAGTTLVGTTPDTVTLKSTTSDPQMHMYGIGSFNPKVARFICVRYRVIEAPGGVTGGTEFYHQSVSRPALSEAYKVNAYGAYIADGAWRTEYIDAWKFSSWFNSPDNITGFRFDWCRGLGVTMEFDSLTITNYTPTHIPVSSTAPFEVGDTIQITDELNMAITTITAIEDGYIVIEPIHFDYHNGCTISLFTNPNLLVNTDYEATPLTYGGAVVSVQEGVPKSVFVEYTSGTTFGVVTDRATVIENGKTYTMSFEARSTNVTALDYNYFLDVSGNSPNPPNLDIIADGQWHSYSVSFKATVNKYVAGLLLAVDTRKQPNAKSFELRKVKLEEGTKSTRWIP